jgi:hypothetical protein
MFEIAVKYNELYTQKYPIITQKLKEKGSKYKLLFQRNKLTPQSRANPEVFKIFKNLIEAKIVNAST